MIAPKACCKNWIQSALMALHGTAKNTNKLWWVLMNTTPVSVHENLGVILNIYRLNLIKSHNLVLLKTTVDWYA